jgi:hypothetical protein
VMKSARTPSMSKPMTIARVQSKQIAAQRQLEPREVA